MRAALPSKRPYARIGDNHCLCAEPLFRPEPVTPPSHYAAAACAGSVSAFGRYSMNVGYRTITIQFRPRPAFPSVDGRVHRHQQLAAVDANLNVGRTPIDDKVKISCSEVLDDISRMRRGFATAFEAMPTLSKLITFDTIRRQQYPARPEKCPGAPAGARGCCGTRRQQRTMQNCDQGWHTAQFRAGAFRSW